MADLTPRQEQIAALVADGLSNKAIAHELEISHGRVRQHITQMGKRLPGSGPPRWRIMSWFIRRQSDAA